VSADEEEEEDWGSSDWFSTSLSAFRLADAMLSNMDSNVGAKSNDDPASTEIKYYEINY
jgi:hypothetical protein